jgi:hypothetical protein
VRQNGMTKTPALSPTIADGAPAAVEAPPLAPDGAPLCYVVDEEPIIRHFLSRVLHGSGVDTVEFPHGAAMRKAIESRPPALVFHSISLESARVCGYAREAPLSRRRAADERARRSRA